jgi:hypothetical protein
MNGLTLTFSGFFCQLRGRASTGQVQTIGAQDQFKVFHLICFVRVPNEFVITKKVEKCIAHNFKLVVFVYVGACCVKGLAGLDGFGDACFDILEGFVK